MAAERFPVEAGHIMQFARAVGDENPVYHDAEHAAATEVGAIVAPPTFVTASAHFDPDNPLRPKLGRQADAAPSPSMGGEDGKGVSLHAEQHYEYHRPVVAGDVLYPTSRRGERWEKEGRSGKLEFFEIITEFRTAEEELVVTARTVGVHTQVGARS